MFSTPPDIYTDLQGLSRLRGLTRQDSAKALSVVSQQFEALFLQMMLKSVRNSSFGDPLFDSRQLDFYRDMHDQQLAVELAHKGGIGIAEMLVTQLGKEPQQETGKEKGDETFPLPSPFSVRAAVVPAAAERVEEIGLRREPPRFDSPTAFVEHLWPAAERAASELGVSPEILLAQAALETGWGKKIIQQAPGISSHNLFNIKADRRWKGERTGIDTLEYIDGSMVKRRAAFRVYGSYAESFADYVAFLRDNPRYGEALQKVADERAFITALHRAGYATDPEYAAKILRIRGSQILATAVDGVKFSRPPSTDPYEVALAGDE